jgi:hypothetical protein
MAEEQAPLAFLDDLNESQTQNATFIAKKAKEMGINPRLAVAIAYRESRLNFGVDDGKDGEIGVMQVKIPTGELVGFSEKDLRDPKKNVEAGLMYLKQGITKFGDPKLAVVGYNAGMDHKFFEDPEKHKIPPSTRDYVKEIQNWGGFTEPVGSPDETSEDASSASEFVGDEGMRGPPAPPSNMDFLMSKAKAMYDSGVDTAANMTASDYMKLGGAGAGAFAGPRMGTAIENVQKAANAPLSGGDKWRQNWAGQGGQPTGASVPEASAAYQRSKGQGKVSGRVSQMYGPPSRPPEPGVFRPGRLSMPNQPVSPISQTGQTIGKYAGAMLDSPLGKKATGALGGYGAVTQGMEAIDQARKGDKVGAAISGLGALGSGVVAIPTPVTRAVGAGMSMLSPAALWMLQHSRKMSPENAQGALGRTDAMGNPIP